MKNYVIINGVNSNTITGLMINELPPITKPQMRVQSEEIDGRDGDITTNLGYSAYDKTITIGLFGTGYDINNIVAFFNGEGTIVFSNESDKYYNFKIINQIDYSALQKFKFASVTFHCQPFKYPTNETPVEIEYEYVEQDNVESASMNNTEGETYLGISLKGNTSQYTTTGKNFLNGNMASQTGLSFVKQNDGSFLVNGTISEMKYGTIIDYDISMPVGTYTLSVVDNSGNNYAGDFYINGTYMFKDLENKTYTTTETTTHLKLVLYLPAKTYTNVVIYLQLEAGDTATDYEPYTAGASPNPDYPQPINVVSGDNTIIVCGENLAYDTWASDFVSRINDNTKAKLETVDSKNCLYYKATAGYGEYDTKYMFKTNWKENTQYTFSMDLKPSVANEVNLAIAYTNNTSQTISATISANTWKHINFTSVANKTIKYLQVIWSSGYCYIDLDTYQVEEGNTETSYKKIGISYPINLPSGTELCKIGTYQDYFTKNSDGQWCKYNAIGKVVIDGSETDWRFNSNNNLFVHNISQYGKFVGANVIPDIKSNYFVANTFNLLYSAEEDYGISYGSSSADVITIRNKDIASVSNFETWLGTHNTTVYYVLATPYLSLIEDETLISQLDNIQNAMSYEGTTNVSQINNDKPFLMDLKAMKKDTNEVTINNIGNATSKPLIELVGNGNIDIYLNGNQVLQANVDEKMNIDIDKLEAYNPDTSALLNRQVIGNYNSMTLQSGNNTIKMSGNLSTATISNYTRWI